MTPATPKTPFFIFGIIFGYALIDHGVVGVGGIPGGVAGRWGQPGARQVFSKGPPRGVHARMGAWAPEPGGVHPGANGAVWRGDLLAALEPVLGGSVWNRTKNDRECGCDRERVGVILYERDAWRHPPGTAPRWHVTCRNHTAL